MRDKLAAKTHYAATGFVGVRRHEFRLRVFPGDGVVASEGSLVLFLVGWS